MATKLEPTLERLQMAGITSRHFKLRLDDALAAAEKCDIEGVLIGMMGVEEELEEMDRHMENMGIPRDEDATAVRRLAYNLGGKAVEEVLATLKAKQCKCG